MSVMKQWRSQGEPGVGHRHREKSKGKGKAPISKIEKNRSKFSKNSDFLYKISEFSGLSEEGL